MWEAGIAAIEVMQRAAANNDLAGFQAALTVFNQRYAQVKSAAQAFGLAQCSS